MKPLQGIFCGSSTTTSYSRCHHNQEAKHFLRNKYHHDKIIKITLNNSSNQSYILYSRDHGRSSGQEPYIIFALTEVTSYK